MTDNDLKGLQAALAEGIVTNDDSTTKAVALALVFGVLSDFIRLVDAVESLAATEANRLTR